MMDLYGDRRVAMVDDVSVAVMAVSASPIDDESVYVESECDQCCGYHTVHANLIRSMTNDDEWVRVKQCVYQYNDVNVMCA